MSKVVTPARASASVTAAGAANVPTSPTRLAPRELTVARQTMRSLMNDGMLSARGIA